MGNQYLNCAGQNVLLFQTNELQKMRKLLYVMNINGRTQFHQNLY